jgi:hypothetical protein
MRIKEIWTSALAQQRFWFEFTDCGRFGVPKRVLRFNDHSGAGVVK